MSNQKHCPSCGYTEEDAKFHMDHGRCKNAGNAPWEKRRQNAAESLPALGSGNPRTDGSLDEFLTPVIIEPVAPVEAKEKEQFPDNFSEAAAFAGITSSQGCQFHLYLQYLLGKGSKPGFLVAEPKPTPSTPAASVFDPEKVDRLRAAEAANREKDAEIERLKVAGGLSCELHGCASPNCTMSQYLADAEKLIAELETLRASAGEKPEDIWGRGWSNGYEWARAQVECRATLAVRNYVAPPTLPTEEES